MPHGSSRRIAPGLLLACAALLLSACGNTRTPVPDFSKPASPATFIDLGYPASGIALQAPGNWSVRAGRAPLVTVVSSGPAVIAVWSYPRSRPLPAGARALARARLDLIKAARARDPRLQLIRSTATTIGQVPVIELDALEQIGRRTRRVRSTHVFSSTHELVLDEYAPVEMFHAVDHAVFSPVKRSLRPLPTNAA